MRRSPMPNRRKPLSPGSSVPRRGALVRSSSLSRQDATRSKPITSKPKHDPAEAGARKAVKARSHGRCEVCWHAPATETHHRQNRSQGGPWAASNLLHLCHRDHMHITVNPALAYGRGWSVRSTSDPARVPVWLAGRGWAYLRADGSIQPAERNAA